MIGGIRYRNHTALKFAAGVTRAVSILTALFALLIALVAMTGGPNLPSASTPYLVGYAFGGVIVLIIGLAYAAMIWGFADALILLADGDDADRRTEQELRELKEQVSRISARPEQATR